MSLSSQYHKSTGKSPYEEASFFSKNVFAWIGPLILLGYQRPLEAEDIPDVPASVSAVVTSDIFERGWKEDVKQYGDKADARRVLMTAYRKEMVRAWLTFIPYAGIMLLQPYLVNDLLLYIADGDGDNYALDLRSGVGLALILGFLSVSMGFFINSSLYQLLCVGFSMKAALVAAIFKKSLRLSSAAKAQQTSGQMITLISGDSERLWNSVLYSNWLWAGPFLMVISMILLIFEAGWAAVAAFAAMAIIAAGQSWIGVEVGNSRKRQVSFTDERTKLINEVLQGIRIIKFYAWEKATGRRVEAMREREVRAITRYQLVKMANTVCMFVAPLVVGFVLFIVYLRLGGELSVAKVYKIYALLNVIRLPFSITPISWASWQEGKNAFDRITAFLLLEEIDSFPLITDGTVAQTEKTEDSNTDKGKELPEKANCLLRFRDASFSWNPSSATPVLQHVTLDVERNDFIAIVGSVGAGKSSLIAAMLGQMVCTEGETRGLGTVRAALVAQEHWIQNVNLRENVLFDTRFDEAAYAQALEASQLVQDLLVLPHADETSIGERGLNLSGGQKARISVARALYAGNHFPLATPAAQSVNESSTAEKNKDIESADTLKEKEMRPSSEDIEMYIFDDSLASVDVHVGKALFEHAIESPAARRACRVVSLSSNYHFLRSFSKIVVMEQGRVAMVGSFAEVAAAFPAYKTAAEDNNEGDLEEEFCEAVEHKEHDNQHHNTTESVQESDVSLSLATLDADAHKEVDKEKQVSKHGIYAQYRAEIVRKREAARDLIAEEDREKGAVALRTYATYFSFLNPHASRSVDDLRTARAAIVNDEKEEDKAKKNSSWWSTLFGAGIFSLILLLFSLNQLVRVYADLWLGSWASDRADTSSAEPHTDSFYYGWFIVLVWATVGLTTLASVVFLIASLGASRSLHRILLQAVLKAPINTYFDVTPVGRILNRFSKDLDSMDALLPDFFLQTLHNAFAVIAILLICLISSAFFVLLFLPLGAALFMIQLFYRKSSREMKRLESVSRSPVYSLFSETLQGLMTIRAYRREAVVTNKFFYLLDRQMAAFFVFYMSSRWLALRLDVISNLVVLAVAILAVILKETGNGMNPNLLGVALVYSLQLTALMQWTVRISIETETNMTSVERLLAFSDIEPERAVTLTPSSSSSSSNNTNNVNNTRIRSRSRTTSQEHEIEFAQRVSQGTQHTNPLWPSEGCIELSNVAMRYRSELPLVLNGVSLRIPGGKKVGVCGRTGAGKSTLMLALFRIVECEEGSRILIDGEDMRSVPLSVLRSRVTIIPQDPFMFSGTLRENLDPFNIYPDAEIWEALDRVHLKEEVLAKFPDKLLHQVSERGENISVGQRQLVCIARALLRKSKIIVMDEATASVDSVTDAKIQSTIKEQFRHCTVLTIAHRLETIADYDIIVVMDQGRVAEVGSPLDLLRDETDSSRPAEEAPLRGIFRSLVDGLGAERKQAFLDVALRKAQEESS